AKRRAAAEAVFKSRDPTALPALDTALSREAVPEIRTAFAAARAAIILADKTARDDDRVAAVRAVEARGDQDALSLLRSLPS
ncbi:hypothetical protein J8J40_32930, partial [Mycobacterium tuberculosis]|nr:hypothetical protein [Mycobacterium tuberculosis]